MKEFRVELFDDYSEKQISDLIKKVTELFESSNIKSNFFINKTNSDYYLEFFVEKNLSSEVSYNIGLFIGVITAGFSVTATKKNILSKIMFDIMYLTLNLILGSIIPLIVIVILGIQQIYTYQQMFSHPVTWLVLLIFNVLTLLYQSNKEEK